MVRKAKEFFRKHGVADVIPISAAFCGHVTDAALILYGMKNYLVFWRRNPEILHKCAQFDLPFKIQYGKALLEAGADNLMLCSLGAPGGVESFKPFAKYFTYGVTAYEIINAICEGLKVVGEKYEAKEFFIPDLVASADATLAVRNIKIVSTPASYAKSSSPFCSRVPFNISTEPSGQDFLIKG
jgi:uroporphyrinogen-III decarboxylase